MSPDSSAQPGRAEAGLRRLMRTGRIGIERSVGLLPLLEAKNRVTRVADRNRVRALEDAEVERLRGQLGRVPEAKVTTVVPTYRRPQLLLEAVDSALQQSEQDQLVFVVSDGEDLPSLPPDERLVAVRLSRNIGVPGAVRNVAIRLSRSPFIAFLDDDNRWLPDHLAVCLDALRYDSSFVYTGIKRVLPDGRIYDVLKVPFDRARLKNENYIDMNATVVRRQQGAIFSRIPRSGGTFPLEDWEFAWRLTKQGAVFVDAATVEWLINPESRHWPGFYEWADGATRNDVTAAVPPDGSALRAKTSRAESS